MEQAVLAAPDDDAPRLAYADAVEKADPERAEFIRLQLDLAKWRKAHQDPPQSMKASARWQQLKDRRGADWAKPLAGLVDKWQYLRGFVEVIWSDATAFLANAEDIYRRAPVLHLDLSGVKPVAAKLFSSPHLSRIHSLNLSNNGLDDADAKAIAASSQLGNLRWLDLRNNKIGAAGLEALASSSNLPRLQYLGLESNTLDDPTPRHADEYDAEHPTATALQKKYGRRPWLSMESARKFPKWPPDRDEI
ncbi:MAG: hypothetical protein JWO36_5469 [Myxococcales bacterium]|nr:hypothetical protein [Myxococcales bacterium]